MEGIIPIIINIGAVALIFYVMWSRKVSSHITKAKKDPKKFLADNIDPSAKNKEGLLKEIEKMDKIIKIDYMGLIKNSFQNKFPKKEKITNLEAKIKRVDGQEIWYKFTMKNNKLIELKETYKPIT
jgi:tRNA C32,U32 (ribose-2'-O)-methylase TrmJ